VRYFPRRCLNVGHRTKRLFDKELKADMRTTTLLMTLFLASLSAAQNKAAIATDSSGAFHPGGKIAFTVKLNEPLPKNARFDFRISPSSVDQQVSLGSGEPVDDKRTEFRVTGTLPDDALAGDWHISVIWLFLPGSTWTSSRITPNDVHFKIEGKPYQIPSTAEVTVAH
jgi:hypothetical protein